MNLTNTNYLFLNNNNDNNNSPNKAGTGILVECNIVLSESIAYAAQQFGIALYESLQRSNERLANLAGYLIDKNSIKFNSKYFRIEIGIRIMMMMIIITITIIIRLGIRNWNILVLIERKV